MQVDLTTLPDSVRSTEAPQDAPEAISWATSSICSMLNAPETTQTSPRPRGTIPTVECPSRENPMAKASSRTLTSAAKAISLFFRIRASPNPLSTFCEARSDGPMYTHSAPRNSSCPEGTSFSPVESV